MTYHDDMGPDLAWEAGKAPETDRNPEIGPQEATEDDVTLARIDVIGAGFLHGESSPEGIDAELDLAYTEASYQRGQAREADAEIEDFYQAEDGHERYVHFNGEHVQDEPQHGDCVDSCPYDTPEQEFDRLQWEAGQPARDAERSADAAVWEAEDIAREAAEDREAGQ